MTVTINGTTGIAGTNGSAGTPAVQGEDTNTGIFFPAADTVAVATAGAERVRVDSSGNAGLGVTPSAWGSGAAARALQLPDGNLWSFSGGVAVGQNYFYNSGGGRTYIASAQATEYYQTAGQHVWRNAPSGTAGNAITFTQAMTLDASGNLSVGTTAANVITSGADGFKYFSSGTLQINNGSEVAAEIGRYGTDGAAINFYKVTTPVGSISLTGSSTTYATSSDYRLKENVAPMQNALDTVAQLNPVTYTWKADGSAGQGFIAHELQAVVPDCVTGEKDAVDAEGNPQYQGVDTSFLVATLVKAIQEQQVLLMELTARVAELEAK